MAAHMMRFHAVRAILTKNTVIGLRAFSSTNEPPKLTSAPPKLPGSEPAKKIAAAEPEPFDNTTFKNEEYFSYNGHSFYDIEVTIDGTGNRQQQPDPRIPYQHTEPWKKADKS